MKRLSKAAIKRLQENIEAEREAGNPQIATDIEMLLKLYLEQRGERLVEYSDAEIAALNKVGD